MKEINIGRILMQNRHKKGITQDELAEYCTERALEINDASAEQFVHYKSEQLEAAMESGEA